MLARLESETPLFMEISKKFINRNTLENGLLSFNRNHIAIHLVYSFCNLLKINIFVLIS
jgi:hypothetical protein